MGEEDEKVKFEARKKYYISSKKSNSIYKKYKNKEVDNLFGGMSWEKDCIFEYLKDEGIHHCFREVRGGWSRTYTDAQLVGKNVKEIV
ncbi:MAG: hypothetical protein IJQ99_09520 [Synergistaceae bacterium]|nr:hypothetical protein [Synergistaceae bacterium]